MDTSGTTRVADERLNQTVEAGIQRPYAYHKPSDDGLSKITQIRKAFSNIDALIKDLAPQSREKSIAITELETAAMWAIKAVVLNDPQSVVEN